MSMTTEQFINNSRELITRLISLFEAKAVYIRRGTAVDAVLAAHLRRAIRAHESILTLAILGHGEDCQVLARVGLEVLIQIRFLTSRDTPNRCQKFLEFEAKQIERTRTVIKKHSPNQILREHPDRAHIEACAARFGTHIYWDRPIADMANEEDGVEVDSNGKPVNLIWYYDVPYFFTSCYAHSSPLGLRDLYPDLESPFRLDAIRQSKLCEDAIFLSSSCLVMTASRISHIWGINLSDNLESDYKELIQPMVKARGLI